MDSRLTLEAEQFPAIDRLIFASDQEGAYRLVRGLAGGSPEEAHAFVRDRFQELYSSQRSRFDLCRFPCGDYLDSEWARQGYYDEEAYIFLVLPALDVRIDDELSFLAIGGPGVDGIEWGYRLDEAGIWAYYPIEGTFVPLAESVAGLIERWSSGAIRV